MTTKLIWGRYLVRDPTSLPDGILDRGAVLVEGGRVTTTGTYPELAASAPDAERIGSDRHLVMPGLINSHHHGWGLTSAQLGCRDDPLELYGLSVLGMPPVSTYADTAWAAMRMVRSGVTTVLHSGYLRDWGKLEVEVRAGLSAYDAIGLRVAYALPIFDQNTFVYEDDDRFLASLPPPLAKRARRALSAMGRSSVDEYLDLFAELRDEYRDSPRLRIMLGPVGPEWCSDDLLSKIRSTADVASCGIHLHCLESPFQREYFRRLHGEGVLQHLDSRGFLGPGVSLAHAVWLTEEDMELCAREGVTVCHNPSSNLRLHVGILPLSLLLEEGVLVALGMDSTTLNDDEDMWQEMRLASVLHRLPRGLTQTRSPSSSDILRLATVNGGTPTTFGQDVGRLTEGSHADIVLVDLEALADPYLDPSVHPIDALMARAKAGNVDSVLIGGEVIMRDGQILTVDETAIAEQLRDSVAIQLEPHVKEWRQVLTDLRGPVERFYRGWEEPAYDPYYVPNSRR
jgi:5-methylthioadenosine/S-adenosylhomocysteine deaminase